MSTSILDDAIVTSRYFFPAKSQLKKPFWVDCGDARLGCYFNQPFPGRPVVIHFHGNGEIVSDYVDYIPSAIEKMGFNCLLAEYRGYGASNGTPALVKMLSDVAHIVNAIGLPHNKIVLFGRSIGSLYALHGAYLFPKIAGLIIESGISNILDRILLRVDTEELGVTYEEAAREAKIHFDHKAKMSSFKGSTLIMHTRDDGIVDVSHAKQLFNWANDPKHLEIFDQGDHNSILFANTAEYFRQVSKFLNVLFV
jgi:hypothetical protein